MRMSIMMRLMKTIGYIMNGQMPKMQVSENVISLNI